MHRRSGQSGIRCSSRPASWRWSSPRNDERAQLGQPGRATAREPNGHGGRGRSPRGFMSERPVTEQDLLRWSEALAGIARTGLGFTENPYEKERFEEILRIAADIGVAAGRDYDPAE